MGFYRSDDGRQAFNANENRMKIKDMSNRKAMKAIVFFLSRGPWTGALSFCETCLHFSSLLLLIVGHKKIGQICLLRGIPW